MFLTEDIERLSFERIIYRTKQKRKKVTESTINHCKMRSQHDRAALNHKLLESDKR